VASNDVESKLGFKAPFVTTLTHTDVNYLPFQFPVLFALTLPCAYAFCFWNIDIWDTICVKQGNVENN
jgi:hypothetical protein